MTGYPGSDIGLPRPSGQGGGAEGADLSLFQRIVISILRGDAADFPDALRAGLINDSAQEKLAEQSRSVLAEKITPWESSH